MLPENARIGDHIDGQDMCMDNDLWICGNTGFGVGEDGGMAQ